MPSGRVCCIKLIVAGLIRGAKIGIAVNIMKDLTDALPSLAGWHLIIPVWEAGKEYWAE